jgi:SAM-dependent methyltransferase
MGARETVDQEGLDYIREISPDDQMRMGTDENYFRWGLAALSYIQRALSLADGIEPKSILDLPSGHGRVLRMLKAAYPEASITACDLDRDAVDFCARVLEASPVYSTEDPDELGFDEQFDLIWCGSLLTHVDADRGKGFLRLFARSLTEGGIVVFTTHGRFQARRIRVDPEAYKKGGPGTGYKLADPDAFVRSFDASGFAFEVHPRIDRYGHSLASPAWVCGALEEISGLRLISYTELGWNGRQDMVCCQRV